MTLQLNYQNKLGKKNHFLDQDAKKLALLLPDAPLKCYFCNQIKSLVHNTTTELNNKLIFLQPNAYHHEWALIHFQMYHHLIKFY